MKKHNLFKVVLIAVAVAVLLSWVLPMTYYSSGGLSEDAVSQIGIFELMSYGNIAIQYFGHIAIYVLVVGGLYGVLHKIPGYRNLLEKIVKGFENREYLFMVFFMALFAMLSAMAGLSLTLLVFFPFVISIILMMGYDKITAALVTAGSTIVGLIGSVFSTNNTYGIDVVIGSAPEGAVLEKCLLLFIGLVLLIINTIAYARKHRNALSVSSEYVPKVTTKNQKCWPLVVILDVVFLICILGFVSWNLFGITLFDKLLKYFNGFELFDITIYEALFGLKGDYNSFGNWTLTEMSVVILVASGLIALCYKVKFSDFLTNFLNGAKRAIKPAVLLIFIYTVLVCTTYIPTVLTMLKPILDSTASLNVFTMSFSAFISSIFGVELYYAATSVLPYVTGALFPTLVAEEVTLLSLIWQSMYGVAMLVAPTSVILMSTLAYLHLPYQNWLKAIWKFLLELVIILLIIFIIIPMI